MPNSVVSSAPPIPAPAPRIADLEIKDAQLIFGAIWADLLNEVGRENLRFPKEIILLGGAPGAGKGTNTGFIAQARGLTCEPIVISALLDTPEAKRLKDGGNLVGDRDGALADLQVRRGEGRGDGRAVVRSVCGAECRAVECA